MKKALLILIIALSSSGCAAPWETARSTVQSAQSIVDNFQTLVDDQTYQSVMSSANIALENGTELVDRWEQVAEEPEGWSQWSCAIMGVIERILMILKNNDVDIPEEVIVAANFVDEVLKIVACGL